jgi:hypothetical protein
MMERLEARARAAGEAGVARAMARVAARLREALPEARIEEGDKRVTIVGRRLLLNPALRWIGGWLR